MTRPLVQQPGPIPLWLWNGTEPGVSSAFQPIVDLRSGEVIGYEVLSRGQGSLESPLELFSHARLAGYTWELERACWTSALRCIASLSPEQRRAPFFFNVSPDVLSDPRFGDGSTLALLERHGLTPQHLVLELTEKAVIEDGQLLQRLTREVSAQGFGLALDDFGAGHSGLVTLVNCLPRFIKLDQALVRDVHLHPYRQHLVKSLVDFSASVDAILIAEGVETWDEMMVLLRLGIRHAQGYLLARPAPSPGRPTDSFESRRREVMRALEFHEEERDASVGALVIRRASAEATASDEELGRIFREAPQVDHVVLLEGSRPKALVTRKHYAAWTEGSAARPADLQPLIIEDRMAVTALVGLAMARGAEAVYDPVIVTDDQGHFLGTVTMKQILLRSTELAGRPSTK
ncbi:EAL domain-containing protein [Myxococcus sp. K15C18031901]|uniref:EAL domain-containing protein n=1 Tax=Myxococcus dinghuensis TaxID=2906761 RepID=UPI0020A78BBC|nr:EAL domain-containing protein [Myxococcus dinghuensis]MCP3097701.1 EAL domain-containing protein [Myxococcus dinghuensis]